MIRAIIVDDEAPARANLTALLQRQADIEIIAACHSGGAALETIRSLAELEQDLDPAMFCRIHRSTIINIQRLLAVELCADGEHEAVLSSGARLRVSRTYRKALLELTCNPAAPAARR